MKKLQSTHRIYTNLDNSDDIVSVEEDLEHHEKKQSEFEIMEDAMAKIGEPCKSLLEAYYLQKKQMLEIASDFWIY